MKKACLSAAALLLTLLLAAAACAEFSFGGVTWSTTAEELEALYPDAEKEETTLLGSDQTLIYSLCTAETLTEYCFINGRLWAIYDMNENGFGTEAWTRMYNSLVRAYGEPGGCEEVDGVFFQIYEGEEHNCQWLIDEDTALLMTELDGWTVVIYEDLPLFDELLGMIEE